MTLNTFFLRTLRHARIVDFWECQCHVKCLVILGFGLVWFYGISTIVGYLMPKPLYTYILNIYDLIWLGFMAYQPL